ncbi:MAG: DNA adenine methylase [Phycisphaerae bacterium]|nr:DNA adenine methylase [Phycisphaerae bacterium]
MMGGKAGNGTYQWIINQIPPHGLYIELFAGDAAILRRKRPAMKSIAVELDPGAAARLGGKQSQISPPIRATLEVVNACATEWLRQFGPTLRADSFIYADPPYPLGTRASHHRYEHELTDRQHLALLELLRAQSCMVMVSSYPSDLYSDAMRDWRTLTHRVTTRGGTLATEVIWMNYAEPTELHDYQYLGRDRRERERIHRRQRRWRRRLLRLQPLERAALLESIRAVDRRPA